MCGIAGFVERDSDGRQLPDRAIVLDRMCRIIEHRGPDDQGTMVDGAVALGMRRLSIIDLAGGHQPMTTPDGDVTIVFNGEIYNYRELFKELETRGHRFQTRSDTESILRCYREFGEDCVQHLRGMFAFAIWDAPLRKLFVARDRAGEKPLYYTTTAAGTFVFGSELKCLLEHPEVKREINPEALDAYLTFGYVPDPLSIFNGIHKLPPGHFLTFSDGNLQVQQYWDFPDETNESLDYSECLEELRRLLKESVRMRLVSDVPLGAFLSGGVDSSTIVALMAQEMSEPVKTFSIGFAEDSYNELKYARVVAKHFGTDHRELIVTPDVCHVIDELLWHFDEPFADQSVIPTYYVSKLAREHVKVALSGDGGDELFAGYTRYAIDRKRQGFEYLPRVVRQRFIKSLSQRLPHGARGRNYLYNVSQDPVERYIDSISVFTNLVKSDLYSEDFLGTLRRYHPAAALYREFATRVRSGDAIDRLLYLDSKTYLPGDILTKVDRMSMAVSLEARVPLLDHVLIEFVARMPSSWKMRGLESKFIFKEAVKGLVPDEILNRPKQGFGVPIATWINDQLRERIDDTLSEQRTRQRGFIRPEYIDVLRGEHNRGRRDHSQALWTVLMFELWCRTYVDHALNASPSPPTESTLVESIS
jgi:asparagine synthase (glutamine-hydrolysing)